MPRLPGCRSALPIAGLHHSGDSGAGSCRLVGPLRVSVAVGTAPGVQDTFAVTDRSGREPDKPHTAQVFSFPFSGCSGAERLPRLGAQHPDQSDPHSPSVKTPSGVCKVGSRCWVLEGCGTPTLRHSASGLVFARGDGSGSFWCLCSWNSMTACPGLSDCGAAQTPSVS